MSLGAEFSFFSVGGVAWPSKLWWRVARAFTAWTECPEFGVGGSKYMRLKLMLMGGKS